VRVRAHSTIPEGLRHVPERQLVEHGHHIVHGPVRHRLGGHGCVCRRGPSGYLTSNQQQGVAAIAVVSPY